MQEKVELFMKAKLENISPHAKSIHQLRVEQFMNRAKHATPDKPAVPDEKTVLLRAKLITEESLETVEAMGVQIIAHYDDEMSGQRVSVPIDRNRLTFEVVAKPDIVKTVDGLADIYVVTTGTASAFGVNMTPVLTAVDENNLAKFGPGHSIRDDGKIIKPPGHKPPDFENVLKQLGWQPQASNNHVREGPKPE